VLLKLAHAAHARIRICPGIYGCDDRKPGAGPTTPPTSSNGRAVTFPPHYGGDPLAQDQDQVDFECPANGPRLGDDRTGYFSVMLGAPRPGAPLDGALDVALIATPGATYPATEAEVFTYREGGFYGSLFDQRAQREAACPADAMLSGHEYACYSDLWSAGAAMLADRLCAGPSGVSCFVNPPSPCDDTGRAGGCAPTLPVAAEGPTYDQCDGSRMVWEHPYTSYLNHPCDLFTSRDDCRASLNPRWVDDLARTRPPDERQPPARAPRG